jgi:hypothetical protein
MMRRWLLVRKTGSLITVGVACSGLLGCIPPDPLVRLTVVNPCDFTIEASMWSAGRGETPEDAGLPNDGVYTIQPHDSVTVLGLPWRSWVVRVDRLGFRQELIPPPGGELSDVTLTPDATSCEG